MPAYAIAHLHDVTMGPAIIKYLEEIDATLRPFDGRFIIHGGDIQVLEGSWAGDLIIIEFPDEIHARNWYESPAYQKIVVLRTQNSTGDVVLARGVPPMHRATDILQQAAPACP